MQSFGSPAIRFILFPQLALARRSLKCMPCHEDRQLDTFLPSPLSVFHLWLTPLATYRHQENKKARPSAVTGGPLHREAD
jgi:hypothetical protein